MFNLDDIKSFIDVLPDPALLVDINGGIVESNENASVILGQSKSQLLCLGIEDLIPERFRKSHIKQRQSFLMNGKQRSMSDNKNKYFPTQLADGREILSEISIGKLEVKNFTEHLWLVIIIDRTDKYHMEEELKKRATIDQLTEMYTRTHFVDLAENELRRALRYENPLAVIYFDIDDFKIINDSYGHYVGDLVLRQVGNICKQGLRNIDFCGRVGGEEFVVVLPETNIEGAMQIADRIRKSLRKVRVPTEDDNICFSASFGVAVADSSELELEGLLKRADKALYRAKADGKDCVCAAD